MNLNTNPTREELLREVEILRQMPIEPESSLLGRYANLGIPNMTQEEFHAQLYSIATEWEQEFD